MECTNISNITLWRAYDGKVYRCHKCIRVRWLSFERVICSKTFNFMKYYVNFRVATLQRHIYRLNMKIGSKHFVILLKVTCTSWKCIQFLSLKRQFAQKTWHDPVSKRPKSSRHHEVSIQTYNFWASYEIKYSDIKALGISKLRTEIGYILFTNSYGCA